MKTRSASEGMVWITPTTASTAWPRRGRRKARTPSGTATAIARVSDTPTSSRCSAVYPRMRAIRPSAAGGAAIPRRREKEGRRGALRQTATLGAAVEVRHRRGVDGAFETRDGPERGRPAPRRVRAVHQDRVVAREEPQIIAQAGAARAGGSGDRWCRRRSRRGPPRRVPGKRDRAPARAPRAGAGGSARAGSATPHAGS